MVRAGRRHVLQPGHRQPALRYGAQHRRPYPGELRLQNPTLFWNNALANIWRRRRRNITAPYAFANKYERRTPYTWEYLLNVQRELGQNLVVEVGYLGSISRKLEFLRAVNEALPGTTGSAQTRAPYPNFGRIQLVDNGANGDYNSGSIKLTKRFSAGFSVLSFLYVFEVIGRFERHPRPRAGHAVSAKQLLPQMRVGTVGVRYAPPVCDLGVVGSAGRAEGGRLDVENAFLNGIVGGWQTGAIWTVQSGFPQTVTIGGVDRSGTGAGFDRPNATGVSPYPSNPTPSRWFNPAAFVEQPAGTFGNVGRNTLIGPGIFALDFSAHKEFRMWFSEQHTLQFRFEAFNVLNHPVWGAPNGNILSSGFGTVTGTAVPMRQLQLALKYFF